MSICWHDDTILSLDHRYRGHIHDDARLIWYGRCRSGRRWFWAAEEHTGAGDSEKAHGLEDTEDAANAAARAAVEHLADGAPAVAYLRHKVATRTLKDINAAKRPVIYAGCAALP